MSSSPRYRKTVTIAAALAGLVGLGAVCEALFGGEPGVPVCRVIQPTDSAAVSGKVQIRAEAFDTSGIRKVEFYVNNQLIGSSFATPSTPCFIDWDATDLPEGSWHTIFCLAHNYYDKVGSSDTISVQILHESSRNVFHGAFRLDHNRYWRVGFTAGPEDTLAGEFRVLAGRNLSRFIWLDAVNFSRFREGQSYTPLSEHLDLPALDLREAVPAADSFYVVFVNTSGTRVDVWARFTLE